MFERAREADAAEIAALRTAAANELTRRYGEGHWSSGATARGVLRGIADSIVVVYRERGAIVGVLRLGTKKPWAIDPQYFVPVPRPLYLVDMAVLPDEQGRGIGRRLLGEARETAMAFPAQSIRLDAYDAPAGAGEFYAKCGYTEVGRVTFRGVPLVYYELVV